MMDEFMEKLMALLKEYNAEIAVDIGCGHIIIEANGKEGTEYDFREFKTRIMAL